MHHNLEAEARQPLGRTALLHEKGASKCSFDEQEEANKLLFRVAQSRLIEYVISEALNSYDESWRG